jgi:hypothetical protein
VLGWAAAGAVCGGGWPAAYQWWTVRGNLVLFEWLRGSAGFGGGPALVLGIDAVAALVVALPLAMIFARWARGRAYLAEAVALAAFAVALLVAIRLRGDSIRFFAQQPALWLFLLTFAIAVGEVAKRQRRRSGHDPGA